MGVLGVFLTSTEGNEIREAAFSALIILHTTMDKLHDANPKNHNSNFENLLALI
jgi:hypothetical protein